MLYSIVLFIFVVICLLLVGIILLQTSQTGGMGSIGGGNSYLEGALGGQGADSLLLRTTTIFAVIFMCLAIFLNYLDNPKSTNNITVESSIEYSSDSEESDMPDLNLSIPDNEEKSEQESDKVKVKPIEPKKLPLNTSGE